MFSDKASWMRGDKEQRQSPLKPNLPLRRRFPGVAQGGKRVKSVINDEAILYQAW
jgi:hypothetical protein